MDKKTTLTLDSIGENGTVLKVTVNGESSMPFWKHDLKLEAVKALLETVDIKDFFEDDKYEEFDAYMTEIQEILNSIKGL